MAEDSASFVQPVRPVRTFEAAIDEILLGIERARLSAGDALPNETQLSAQLGIAKPTLRQALRVLERAGLIAVRRGRDGGIFLITPFVPSDSTAIEASVIIEEDAAVRLLRARRAIETAVNMEAVHAATEDDFSEIERIVELMRVEEITPDQFLRADTMFHRAVARATHNPVLIEALRLTDRHRAAMRDERLGERIMSVYDLHNNHLAALRSRDPERVLAALDTHLRWLEDTVADNVGRPWAELFAPDAAWIKASAADASPVPG